MEFTVIIYLIDLLGSLVLICSTFLIMVLVVISVLLLLFPIAWDIINDMSGDQLKRLKNLLSTLIKATIFALVCVIVIPSTETFYKMLVAYGAQSIVENPQVKEVLGESLDVLNLSLKEYKES